MDLSVWYENAKKKDGNSSTHELPDSCDNIHMFWQTFYFFINMIVERKASV